MPLNAIILAAGKGTRMKSEKLKVAHEVGGKPIVEYVVDAVLKLGVEKIYMVVGHQSELLKEKLKHPKIKFVAQNEQLGTGHAVQCVASAIDVEETGDVLILAGDCPLIEPSTLNRLTAVHNESNASGTILTTIMDDPGSYGRIIRGEMGTVMGIKEAKDCSNQELDINEVNSGVYCFDSPALFKALNQVRPNNQQGEYYLTDVIHILKESGASISAHLTDNADQTVGINTRMDLAKINQLIYRKNNLHFMQEGVTIIDPKNTYIDSTVEIGKDSIIHPFTIIVGQSKIGHSCEIEPHCFIKDSTISDKTHIPSHTRQI